MKLLADENIDARLVLWLERSGHDVMWIKELSPGIDDVEVLAKAELEERVLLTNDLDFGELVVLQDCKCIGVILLRLSSMKFGEVVERLGSVWALIEPVVVGNLVVVGEKKVRVRELQM